MSKPSWMLSQAWDRRIAAATHPKALNDEKSLRHCVALTSDGRLISSQGRMTCVHETPRDWPRPAATATFGPAPLKALARAEGGARLEDGQLHVDGGIFELEALDGRESLTEIVDPYLSGRMYSSFEPRAQLDLRLLSQALAKAKAAGLTSVTIGLPASELDSRLICLSGEAVDGFRFRAYLLIEEVES